MRFTVQAPDGRKITLEGDKAPTEQELNDIFNNAGSQEVAAKPQEQPKTKQPYLEQILGKIATLDKGATFGLGRKAGGLINAIGSYPIDRAAEALGVENTPSFWDRYHEIVDPTVTAQQRYAEEHPTEAFVAEMAASIANPVNRMGVNFITKGGNIADKAVRSTAVGGGIGGFASAMNAENLNDVKDNAIIGSETGATIGAALPLAGAGLRGLGWVGKQILGKTTGAGDKAIADAYAAGVKGNSAFLDKMRGDINADALERKVENNFNKIKQNRSRAYEEDMSRLKLETKDKKLSLKPVIEDIRAIINKEGGGAPYLVDDETAKVLNQTKSVVNQFYKDGSRHNLEGFDNLKKRLFNITTKEGSNSERVKTEITNSVRKQIMDQSPEYAVIENNYAKDSDIINDLRKVFSFNRNANSETTLRKIQSTARNNANTDWSYRAQLLKQIDPTGEIQQEISANALNSYSPRGLLGGGFAGANIAAPFFNPATLPAAIAGVAATSPRLVGNAAYLVGRADKLKAAENLAPYIAQYLAGNQ